jgi:hypothetical protein
MSDLTPSETANLDRYGSVELDWSRARSELAERPTPVYRFTFQIVVGIAATEPWRHPPAIQALTCGRRRRPGMPRAEMAQPPPLPPCRSEVPTSE